MERVKFNEGWKVWKDTDPFELVFRVPDDAKEMVLPHDAMFHEEQRQGAVNGGYTGNIDAGEYKYYKQFYVPEEYQGGHVMLQFEGIYRNAAVFVNQSKVGESAYGYTDFTVDIGDYLKYGADNDILVAVKCGTRSSRWYSGAGIYKDVWLIRGGSLYVKPYGLRMTTLDVDEDGALASVYGEGAVPFDLNALPHPDYEKIFVDEGFQIELGGRNVEVLGVKPAHCNSSLFYLDRGHRMLFCGDEIEAAQVLMFDNSKNPKASYDVKDRLLNLKSNTQEMKNLSGEYDYLLPNHNGFPIAKSYLDEYIELVDHIFDGTAKIEDRLNHPYIEMDPKAPDLCRVRWKHSSIIINKELLMTVYGAAN